MSGIKVSALEYAGTLGEQDLLYLIRRSQDGKLESRHTKLGDLLAFGGGGGGLPDLTSATDPDPIDTDVFYQRVNATLSAPKPAAALSNVAMVHQLDDPNNMSMGVITVFPTAKGRYIHCNGPGVLGGGDMGDFLMYMPDAGAPSFISYFTIPSAIKGEKGDPGTYVTHTKRGGWVRNVGSDWGNDSVYIKTASLECWKVTVALDGAAGDTLPNVRAELEAIPCDVNGHPLMYTLHTQVTTAGASDPPTVAVVLTVYGEATQQLNVGTGAYTPIGLINNVVHDPVWILTW